MRQFRKIPAKTTTIALVVEGETEMWYLQMLKKNEERTHNVRINIKPEIPQNSKLEDQYNLVLDLAIENKAVFWILDFDTILKETREWTNSGKSPLVEFLEYRNKLLHNHENVKVLINNPCLEYWFLLHFVRTQKLYTNCESARKQLENKMPGYEKTQRYFKSKNNDIYARLKPALKNAIANATAFGGFDFNEPKRAMCEMDILFLIDELRRCRE